MYVFTRGSTWQQQAYVKASNAVGGAQFGLAVSLSNDGNVLAVGAGHEAARASEAGQADRDHVDSVDAVEGIF